MTIGNDTYKTPKRLKINEGLCMIPDTHIKEYKQKGEEELKQQYPCSKNSKIGNFEATKNIVKEQFFHGKFKQIIIYGTF